MNRSEPTPPCPATRERNPSSTPLAELFDYLDNVLAWIKDRQGRYLWVNRAFLLSFAAEHGGRPVALTDVLGKTDYELSPAFLADQFRMDDEHVLAGGRIVQRIEQVGHADGPAGWNITHKIPLRNPAGEIEGTAGMTRPLSDAELPAADGFGRLMIFLRDRYSETVSNRQMAKLAGLSVRAFERKFSAAFHLTPQKYLRRLRLRVASRGLVYSSRPIVEIGIGCGFADQSHFTREFRRAYGCTPREYRNRYAPSATPS